MRPIPSQAGATALDGCSGAEFIPCPLVELNGSADNSPVVLPGRPREISFSSLPWVGEHPAGLALPRPQPRTQGRIRKALYILMSPFRRGGPRRRFSAKWPPCPPYDPSMREMAVHATRTRAFRGIWRPHEFERSFHLGNVTPAPGWRNGDRAPVASADSVTFQWGVDESRVLGNPREMPRTRCHGCYHMLMRSIRRIGLRRGQGLEVNGIRPPIARMRKGGIPSLESESYPNHFG